MALSTVILFGFYGSVVRYMVKPHLYLLAHSLFRTLYLLVICFSYESYVGTSTVYDHGYQDQLFCYFH